MNENVNEKKNNYNKYSREIAFPPDVAERYKEYCAVTKMKLSEPLRVLVLESLPQLHTNDDLSEIIRQTQERSPKDEYKKLSVRLPQEAVDEINTYCKFFKINWRRCHFLYFLVEKKLLQLLKDVLQDEDE